MENIICGYDGFKLFIPGEAAIKHLVANYKQFNLYGRYKVDEKEHYQLPLPLKGEYEKGDYKLTITATKYNGEVKYKGGQEGVEIKGSFHKLYTGGENHSQYYWHQFKETVELLCKVFNTTPAEIHIINLELGLNLSIPSSWGVTAKDIIRNILAFRGNTFKERSDINHNKDGYYLQFALTQYLLKIYDKAMQNSLPNEKIFRFELKVLKSAFLKPLGIVTVNDILDYEKHQALSNELNDLFSHLVIYQDEVDKKILLPDGLWYAWQFSQQQDWEDLHVLCRHRYKYCKKKLEDLINEHCKINYRKELQALINSAINAIPAFTPICGKTGNLQTSV